MKKERQGKTLVIGTLILIAVLGIYVWFGQDDSFDFEENLNDTFVTISEEGSDTVKEITLQELSYYIMLGEGKVNLLAEAYDSTNTQQFWNLYTNHTFIQKEVKETVMNSCIRDNIYCLEAEKEGISLTKEEQEQVETDAQEVYDGLSYKQSLATKLTAEDLTVIMGKVVLASKYANYLIQNKDFSAYTDTPENSVETGGEYYEEKKASYHIEIDEKWEEVLLGNITVEATTGNTKGEETTDGEEQSQ